MIDSRGNNVLTEIVGVDTWKIETNDLSYLFAGFYKLESVDISNWNLKNVTNMSNMFECCRSLTEPPIKNIPDSVSNISNMFKDCTNITDISGMTFGSGITTADNWCPPNLITANNIKINCVGLIGTHSTTNKLFRDCKTLKYANNVVLGSNITNIMHLFNGCSALESVSLSGGGELTDISCLFFWCEKLSSVDISGLNLSNVKYAGMAFQVCSSLKV
jgi:surface protein